MRIPNEHQLKLNSIKDAKKLPKAVEKRFGENATTKNTQRNLLKQEYKNFTAPSSEMLDQTFDRLQKLVSQLELLEENLLQEDVNEKLLRSLLHEWNTHVVVWRNKANLDTMSMDDLYKNLKSDQAEEGPNYALMAFTSSSSDSEKSELMVLCYKTGLESVEERLEFYKKNKSIYLEDIKVLKVKIKIGEIAIRELRKKLEIAQKEKDGIQINVDKFEHASKSLNKLIECQIVDNCKKGLGYENYNAVPPPHTGNFMPSTPDLSFTGLDEFVNKPVVENHKAKSSEEEPKIVRKNDDALIIEEWVSDNEEEDVS
nr:ribonuclease H-like domain-containing protein [Tanacetum cinerariifolium]